MNSCIYEGQVIHNRSRPAKNKFTYNVYMMYIDLDEIELLAEKIWCLKKNKWHLFSFYEKDYLWFNNKKNHSLKERFTLFLKENQIALPQKICLLTNIRVTGYVFNPVSFYFCFDNHKLYHIVAEVTNTFAEQRYYHIPIDKKDGHVYRYDDIKDFYISPFVDSDVNFRFFFQEPAQNFKVCIHSLENKTPIVKTALSLSKVKLTSHSLLKMFCKYPHMTLRVVFLIHYQALRLWWKKVPFFTKKSIDKKMSAQQKTRIVKKT